jgi:hypothetical protein
MTIGGMIKEMKPMSEMDSDEKSTVTISCFAGIATGCLLATCGFSVVILIIAVALSQ